MKSYVKVQAIWTAAIVFSIASTIAAAPSLSQTAFRAVAGASCASLGTLTLHDAKRNKDIAVRVTYPTRDGTYPVILFSHGAGGSKDSYTYLSTYWAEHGYVVIQPTHQDSIGRPASAREGLRKLLQVIRKIPLDYAGWENRSRDVSFVIDCLPRIQRDVPVKLDTARIGIGGHSYGAFTSVIKCGGKVPGNALPYLHDAKDDRFKALLAISPQAVRKSAKEFGFDDKNAWANIRVPAMYMTGTYDQTGWTKAANRKQAFDGSPHGDKYFVVIDGANHMTFAGPSRISPRTALAGPSRISPPTTLKNTMDKESAAAPLAASAAMNAGTGFQRRRLLGERGASQSIAAGLSQRFGPPEKGDRATMLKSVELVTTAFWDRYLKGDIKGAEFLSNYQSMSGSKQDHANFKIETK
ncbi:MAG TPA: hypothetical protein V6D17_21945 [Candidatus Obscuribacterales bacterium]